MALAEVDIPSSSAITVLELVELLAPQLYSMGINWLWFVIFFLETFKWNIICHVFLETFKWKPVPDCIGDGNFLLPIKYRNNPRPFLIKLKFFYLLIFSLFHYLKIIEIKILKKNPKHYQKIWPRICHIKNDLSLFLPHSDVIWLNKPVHIDRSICLCYCHASMVAPAHQQTRPLKAGPHSFDLSSNV